MKFLAYPVPRSFCHMFQPGIEPETFNFTAQYYKRRRSKRPFIVIVARYVILLPPDASLRESRIELISHEYVRSCSMPTQ